MHSPGAAASLQSLFFFFLMIRRPPRSTLDRSSAASDVYKRQELQVAHRLLVDDVEAPESEEQGHLDAFAEGGVGEDEAGVGLSLIHISEPTRPY